MRAMLKSFFRPTLLRCQRGATAVEYGLIVAMIVLAIIAALNNVATKTTGMWNNVTTEVLAH
ncbi:MAG: Flp family type IVb pilin [Sphingobium sp.]|nr:Flp family type IVb pilin [Sphingobium sp.]